MKITLKRTPEQVELVKAMASRNRNVAYEAQVALAEFIGPVLAEVLNNAPTVSNLFQSLQFDADDNPSIPLDLYYNIADEDYVRVWSQNHAGGLPSNQVLPTASELKLSTYSLDSAVDFDRRYAAKSRLDVVGKTFARVAQEILLKQERTSASLLMTALAGATITTSPLGSDVQVFRSAVDDTFLMDDVNNLFTLAKRINSSWIGGTPTERTKGITDLICSPEVVGSIRAMAYNPVIPKLGLRLLLPLLGKLRLASLLVMRFVTSFTGMLVLAASWVSTSWNITRWVKIRSSTLSSTLLLALLPIQGGMAAMVLFLTEMTKLL